MGRGHLVPMVELARFITTHHNATISATLLLPSPPNTSTLHYISAVTAATPSITFHNLSHSNHNIIRTLQSFPTKPKAFIFDFFNHSAAAAAASLSIPTFYYFPNAASCVALFLYLPTIHQNSIKNGYSYVDMLRSIPGLPPLSPEDMPAPISDRHSRSYESFLTMSLQMRNSNGIIVNTFENLEPKATMALKNGACVPEPKTSPPVFCVGPLVSTIRGSDPVGDDGGKECLSWLNSQPSRSVVFLSFGSYGRFSKVQMREIAVALERSGKRFLWVVRDPMGTEEINLEALLTKGFLERTKEKGMVIKNWAPQVEVLSHDSVGGFVTHCGWNSVMEAVTFGVPMVAWPLYAEQNLNKVVIVEEMKVALPLKEDEGGFVRASELEERVVELMESERGRGKEVRERVLAARNGGAAALAGGGFSRVALDELQFQKLWWRTPSLTLVVTLSDFPGRLSLSQYSPLFTFLPSPFSSSFPNPNPDACHPQTVASSFRFGCHLSRSDHCRSSATTTVLFVEEEDVSICAAACLCL
ncbi:UDP-glycosyltransferase 13 [Stylosanthes scabra]|uniref:Glycosyltransferase n=1 Tax=Stylosanthes scabra TaxID=79078 RepID=A0ABU6R364_9FABA|nr:UDP-glycosyltransferase 13 [Stylosanthes scabra]